MALKRTTLMHRARVCDCLRDIINQLRLLHRRRRKCVLRRCRRSDPAQEAAGALRWSFAGQPIIWCLCCRRPHEPKQFWLSSAHPLFLFFLWSFSTTAGGALNREIH
jgi:hypothetical protein